ncbi:nuclear transport factor 2 family protein [Actinacidiphila sp. ITFR-21]|uniref:nuclear transport factor 2 family protein n=1 Tax=Actinacidiphila sp. ITFR-21 TaxID=3075199 RepID=UPI0028899CCF|nr:nuclear transport factor 2 family protein [Streptomyces sp. ITFR-21]WNI16361.1 nuclear transport factor 2 family protein [Streptomyces sp. ITFR-21]
MNIQEPQAAEPVGGEAGARNPGASEPGHRAPDERESDERESDQRESVVQRWTAALEARWRDRDPERIAALFTEQAVYHQGPFGASVVGREAIAEHWRKTLSRQRDPLIWFGAPIVSGRRASVEWWCVLHDPVTGTPRNAAGALALRFTDDGLCTHFHEYFHAAQDSALTPAEGWWG